MSVESGQERLFDFSDVDPEILEDLRQQAKLKAELNIDGPYDWLDFDGEMIAAGCEAVEKLHRERERLEAEIRERQAVEWGNPIDDIGRLRESWRTEKRGTVLDRANREVIFRVLEAPSGDRFLELMDEAQGRVRLFSLEREMPEAKFSPRFIGWYEGASGKKWEDD